MRFELGKKLLIYNICISYKLRKKISNEFIGKLIIGNFYYIVF